MSLLHDLRLVNAQIHYLVDPRLPSDGGGAATHVTGALTSEVDLAHRTLKRAVCSEVVALLFLLVLCGLLPLWLWPALLLGGSCLIVHRGAQYTVMLAPFLPKLTALMQGNAAPEAYQEYGRGRLIVSPHGFNLSPQARSVEKLSEQVLAASGIQALPPLLQLELKSALAAGELERAQELLACALSMGVQLTVPRELGLAAALIQVQRSAALKGQGRTVGLLPPQCGGTLMYPGMPYPSSYVPEWVPPAGLLLGFGAPWTSEHQRRIKSLLSDGRTVATNPKLQGLSLFHQSLGTQGFAPIVLAPEVQDLHCLITGTTGSGKTTLLNLLVNQSIWQRRPTIVLDPKGDPTLKQMLVHALEQAGRDPLRDLKCCDFLAAPGARLESRASAELFATAQGLGSELSSASAICAQLEQAILTCTNVGFNPLTDLNDSVPQMAQLLCCTLPHEGPSATFTAQTERAMECALYCSQVLDGTITLATIKQHFNNWDSMELALRTEFNRLVETLDQPEVSTYYNNLHGIKLSDLKRAPCSAQEAMGCAFLVRAIFGPELKGTITPGDVTIALKQLEQEGRLQSGPEPAPQSADEEETDEEEPSVGRKGARGLWLKHCHEFYAWLRVHHYDTKPYDACLQALLEMLAQDKAQIEKMTMGGRPLFSDLSNPQLQDLLCNGTERNACMSEVIAHNQVLYLNLSTLRNPKTARLVGTMALRTLAHCAAARISHFGDPTMPPVDIYIDEASTLSSDTLLDLLNKTRAAKFHLTLLAQSVEDFYREGSRASCEHLIANCNVRIAMRSMDRATSEQMTRLLGTIDQPTRSANLGGFESSSGTDLSASHSLSSQSVPLFEPSNLALLPNFEFIALLPSGTIYKGLIPRLVPSSFTHLHKASKRYDQALSVISGAHPAA